jgi:hypothetical protein
LRRQCRHFRRRHFTDYGVIDSQPVAAFDIFATIFAFSAFFGQRLSGFLHEMPIAVIASIAFVFDSGCRRRRLRH